ncbi:hypothetical protein VIGAN_08130800, partial [Vigna angularis var. angularis]
IYAEITFLSENSLLFSVFLLNFLLTVPFIGAFIRLTHSMSSSHADELSKINKQLKQLLLSQANFANALHDISTRTTLLESKSPQQSPHHTIPRLIKFDLPTFEFHVKAKWHYLLFLLHKGNILYYYK